MNVAQAIAAALRAEHVSLAAGIGGQSVRELVDTFCATPGMKVCYVRQERVAVDVADGYARVSGQPAVVFTDAGPAAANTMCGIVNSYGDSTPLLFFATQPDRSDLGKRTTKELPVQELFRPVTKWTSGIMDASRVAEIMRRAFVMLRSGRPGPVVIELPADLSRAEVKEFAYEPVLEHIRSTGDPAAIERAARMLLAAKRPYIYVGAGVLFANATQELIALAEMLSAPVATTLNGKSAFPEDHPLSLGIGGFPKATYGTKPATLWAGSADVILTLGCGFKRHATEGEVPQDIKVIQVDVDPFEIHKNFRADIAIVGDAKLVLQQLGECLKGLVPRKEFEVKKEVVEELQKMRREWLEFSKKFLESEEKPINPFRVTWELNKLVNHRETIVLHDAGSVRGSTCQHYEAVVPRSLLGYGVQSGMGWTLGAALGAKLAKPEKLVVAVTGDDAFGETCMDLETSSRYKIPILVVLKNNRGSMGSDRNWPSAIEEYNLGGDYCALARALGVEAERVEDPRHLSLSLKGALQQVQEGRSALVQVITQRVPTCLYRL